MLSKYFFNNFTFISFYSQKQKYIEKLKLKIGKILPLPLYIKKINRHSLFSVVHKKNCILKFISYFIISSKFVEKMRLLLSDSQSRTNFYECCINRRSHGFKTWTYIHTKGYNGNYLRAQTIKPLSDSKLYVFIHITKNAAAFWWF